MGLQALISIINYWVDTQGGHKVAPCRVTLLYAARGQASVCIYQTELKVADEQIGFIWVAHTSLTQPNTS